MITARKQHTDISKNHGEIAGKCCWLIKPDMTTIVPMQEARKYILDKFQEHLRHSFEVFCNRHGIPNKEEHFITFLIDQNLIPVSQLQRFTVCKEFEEMRVEKGYAKSIIVNTLANRFSISERTVWAILKHTKHNKPSEG